MRRLFAVMAVYALFEVYAVNFCPVLINGCLEVSYPSSTTMLVMCVIPTALMQFNTRIRSSALKKALSVIVIAFMVFMVVGRLISGVHWLSDIIGGALISAGLVLMYQFVNNARLNKDGQWPPPQYCYFININLDLKQQILICCFLSDQ